MTRGSIGKALAVCTALALQAGVAAGADWPQWRGPGRDGVASGFEAPKVWPDKLHKLWSVEVGDGLASPVVAGDHAYLHSRRGDDEIVSAFELATGKLLWSDYYRSPFYLSSEARPYGAGPYATPTHHQGRLYTFGMNEVLSAYDAASGKLLWRIDWGQEFKVPHPGFGTSAAPLLVDGQCIVYVGGPVEGALVSLDAQTGKQRWRLDGEGPPYGSPMVAEFGGVRQVVTQTRYSLIGVELATGKQLWRQPWLVPNAIQTPIIQKDRLILSAPDSDLQAIQVTKGPNGWKAETAWSTREGTAFMSSPVLSDGRIYSFSTLRKGSVYSLDAATGKVQWTSPGGLGENAALVSAGDYLFVLLETANLLVVQKGGSAWTEVARYSNLAVSVTPYALPAILEGKILNAKADSATYAYPAILGDRILIKDKDRLTLWSLKGTEEAKKPAR